MSGSNSRDDSPSFNPPFASNDDCLQLKIKTSLASPVATVITTLKVSDILTIELAGITGPLQALAANGQVAGAILSKDQVRLMNCINSGHKYKATVLSVSSGNCEVLISLR